MSIQSQSVLQVSGTGQGVSSTSQTAVLVAYAPPSTRGVRTSQLLAEAAIIEKGTPASSQAVVLVAYRTGSVENLNSRAWTFSLDGHTFYVITLGEQGTFVYDETTNEWAKWQTQGLSGWNMEIGTTWKGKVIAADQSQPVIYELDPSSFLDDGFKTQVRRVTGGLSMRQRTFIANFAFHLTASLGEFDVAGTAPETLPTVNLSTSDDQGKTFQDHGDVVITADDFIQELQWLSLGTMRPPQRIFRVTDTGAIVRIDGADAEIGGEGE